jgi:hypothetical protein
LANAKRPRKVKVLPVRMPATSDRMWNVVYVTQNGATLQNTAEARQAPPRTMRRPRRTRGGDVGSGAARLRKRVFTTPSP